MNKMKILDYEKITLNITDLGMNGEGIAHLNDKTYFVENALTSETVEAKVLNSTKNIVNAKCVKILNESKFRVNPICPYFYECGGCDFQHLEYLKSLDFKQKQILLLLKKIAGIDYKKNIEIIKSDNPFFYRNKLTMQIKTNNNIAQLCYYKKQSHDPVFVNNCYIVNEKFKIVIDLVNKFLKDEKVLSYNEKTKTGYAKHIVARIINNKLLLTFVSVKNFFPSVDKLFTSLLQHFDEVGINLNVNPKDNEILSNTFMNLKGTNFIEFKSLNISQKITNASFLQVNFNVQEKLYSYVLKNVSGLIVNAYSGAGLLSCFIAKNSSLLVNKVIGLEINNEATKLANELVKTNDIINVKNICADASIKLRKLNFNNYTLILDPPRSGIDDLMIKTILDQKPNKIIYISCSLNSLCKNLKELISEYQIEEIKGFDMFPQTKNLETVVILKRRD